MRSAIAFLVLVLLVPVAFGRTRVPDYGISVTSNANWEVLTTEDQLDEAIETLDGQIHANSTNATSLAADIAANESNITANAADIVTNAADIVVNAANITTLSNRVTAVESTNTAQQVEIDTLTTNAVLEGSIWGAQMTTSIQSGTSSVWHEVTSLDSHWFAPNTNAISLSTGKFTAPYTGKYLVNSSGTIYQDSSSANHWLVRVRTDSMSGSASRYTTSHSYFSGAGNHGGSGSFMIDLAVNDWLQLAYYSAITISGNNFFESAWITVEYIGE